MKYIPKGRKSTFHSAEIRTETKVIKDKTKYSRKEKYKTNFK